MSLPARDGSRIPVGGGAKHAWEGGPTNLPNFLKKMHEIDHISGRREGANPSLPAVLLLMFTYLLKQLPNTKQTRYHDMDNLVSDCFMATIDQLIIRVFHKTRQIGYIGNIANFGFPYIRSLFFICKL